MRLTDEEFLNWIADRFVNVHGESPNVDFVQALRGLAKKQAMYRSYAYSGDCDICMVPDGLMDIVDKDRIGYEGT